MTGIGEFDPAYFDLNVQDDVAVATLHGEQLTEEDNLEQLGQELFALVEQFQFRKVLLSLRPLRHVSSSVLGKLITLHRKLGRHEGQLVLCEIRDELREVLSTSKLLTYFTTADDIAAGLAALQ